MKQCHAVLVGALLLLVPAISISASDNEKEPSPEPYSFSYNAESVGGFSSHQESGDGAGKVQGFYIIMGEDGRDRRVDYVADENGYRASISTNEVGTRSEPSADAQFNARLPSQGQLDQAKVTAEEYKYLEEQHAAERERHLSNANQQRQQQQQKQLDFERTNGSSQFQSSSVATSAAGGSPRPLAPNQQRQQQLAYEQNKFTSGSSGQNDVEWRQRAAYNNNLALNQPQPQQRQQGQQFSNQWTGSSSSSSSSSSGGGNSEEQQQRFSASWNNQTSGDELEQQRQRQQQQSTQFGSLESATTLGPLATVLDGQRQQAQQAAWQLADRGVSPARLPNANNNNYLQRQMEQQFMQQAYQLTNQDYPRQQAQFSRQNTIEYNNQRINFTQQRPQQQQQQAWQISNNERVVSTGGDFSQINQQQNNIIDEVSGEQVDSQLSTGSDEANKNVNIGTNYTTSGLAKQTNIAREQLGGAVQQQQAQFIQQQPQTTTTSQPTPSGFLAINLSQDNSSALVQNQQLDQEVDNNRPQQQPQRQTLNTNFQTANLAGGTKTSDQSVQTQNNGDFQQVTVQQQQQQQQPRDFLRPNSIKQVIGSTGSQQQSNGGDFYEQGKPQVSYQNVVSTSTQEAIRPDTTTQAPELTTTTQAPTTTTTTTTVQPQRFSEQQQQVIETSQAPLRFVDKTSTTTVSQRPTVFQQYVTSTVAPTRVSYGTSTSGAVSSSEGVSSGGYGAFVQQTSRRPAFQSQKVDGVKGGNSFVLGGNQREGLNSSYQTSSYNKYNEQPVNTQAQKTFATTDVARPVSGGESFFIQNSTSTTGGSYGITVTSERPEVTQGNQFVLQQQQPQQQQQQASKQSDFNQVQVVQQQPQQIPYQRPASLFDYNRQRQQGVIEINSSTVGPARFESTAQQQQQQQWKGGVKGGSKTNRRQFWLQQSQPQPQQQLPLIPSSQRVFPVTQQPEVPQNRASIDYAASVSNFGSRISGR